VDGDGLIVSAYLVGRFLRERLVGDPVALVFGDLQQRPARGDRLGDEARGLEGAGRVVDDLVATLGLRRQPARDRPFAVLAIQLEIRRTRFFVLRDGVTARALVGGLDEPFGAQTQDVDLDLVQ